jgi:hypothetical protein
MSRIHSPGFSGRSNIQLFPLPKPGKKHPHEKNILFCLSKAIGLSTDRSSAVHAALAIVSATEGAKDQQ